MDKNHTKRIDQRERRIWKSHSGKERIYFLFVACSDDKHKYVQLFMLDMCSLIRLCIKNYLLRRQKNKRRQQQQQQQHKYEKEKSS